MSLVSSLRTTPLKLRCLALSTVSLTGLCAMAMPALAQQAPAAGALPVGGQIVAGQASIGTAGSALTVDQSSQRAIINWQTFDIGVDASATFRVPDANSVTLNRVVGSNGSTIAGRLSSNGKVYVVNPNGVLFTNSAQVDVGGLVASAADVTNADFLAGRDLFTLGGATGAIINHGRITAAPGGSVVLIGGTVSNQGTIAAEGGNIALTAGSKVTLDAGVNGLLKIEVDGATTQTLVENGGLIAAHGGQVVMRAEAASAAIRSVVSNTGTVEARTLANRAGRILLLADMEGGLVQAGGTLDATAPDGGDGGFIETSAASLGFAPDLHVATLATSGKTGTWLIDPYDITISSASSSNVSVNLGQDPWAVQPLDSGANINNATLSAYLGSSNIALNTIGLGSEAGNITVNAPVSWSAATTLTLTADSSTGGIFLLDAITGSHANSGLVLSAGAGGIHDSSWGPISVGTLTANATNGGAVTLNTGLHQVARLGASSASGAFTFANNTDLAVTGPVTSDTGTVTIGAQGDLRIDAALSDSNPIAYLQLSASGALTIAKDVTLSGSDATLNLSAINGYTLDNGARITLPGADARLYINSTSYTLIHDAAQLQAIGSSGRYALANDIDASGNASWNSGAGFAPIGTFSGMFNGTFAGLGHNIDRLTINRPGSDYTGLFGLVDSSTLRDFTLSNASVEGAAYVGAVAGLLNDSTVRNVHVTGSVRGSGAVGGITGSIDSSSMTQVSNAASVTATDSNVGGLVGITQFASNISDSYSVGAISGLGSVGGLVGYAYLGNLDLARVYASGRVSGGGTTGGLIGTAEAAISVSSAYWDMDSTGQTTSAGGGTGIANTDAANQATYAGFDFTNTWVMVPGETRPMLRSEASSVIFTPHALQLASQGLAGSYTLGTNLDLTSAFTANGGFYGDVWGSSGFVPIGASGSPFTGSFDGMGKSITGLMINRPSTAGVGLFGFVQGAGSSIKNVSLLGGSVTGLTSVGSLVGSFKQGTVTNAHASTAVTSASTTESSVGGLIGRQDGGTIADSSASGNVTAAGYTGGGLVGYLMSGTITRSFATGNVTGTSTSSYTLGGLVGLSAGTISQSYATGTVSGSNVEIGGLVGANTGAIDNSYATGAVTGTGGAQHIGGLVGWNSYGATINSAFATGRVTGASSVGGLIGHNDYGSLANAYWNTQTSGQATGIGSGSGSATATGRTTAQLQGSLPTGFSSTIWGTGANLYPYFTWQHATTPVAISGIASDAAGAALAAARVTAVSTGASLGSAVSGANGYYYILADASKLGANGALAFLDDGALQGVGFSDTTGTNGIQNLAVQAAKLGIATGQASLSTTGTRYLATLGSYADADLQAVMTGNFTTPTKAGYALDLTASGASYLLDGSLTSAGALTLNATALDVTGTRTLGAGGNLTLNAPLSWAGTETFTATTTAGDISLGSVTAALGGLALNASGSATASGAVSVKSFNLLGGSWSQVAATLPGFSASDFVLGSTATFLRALGGDGASDTTPYLLADVYGLQGMASTSLLGKHFKLDRDIDASGTASWNAGSGFMPIGTGFAPFTGSLDGGYHLISGLTIARPTMDYVGLFGDLEGPVTRLGLSGGSVSGRTAVGALVGYNNNTVSETFSTASVSSPDASTMLGGLVGINAGTVENSYAAGTVTAVAGAMAGGLVGYNVNYIKNSYASGAVSGTTEAGGLVGVNSGFVWRPFWSVAGTGLSTGARPSSSIAATGLNAADMNDFARFANAGWSIADTGGTAETWRIYDGQTAPLLRGFLTPLTVTGEAVTKTYDGSAAAGSGTLTYGGAYDPALVFGTAGYRSSSANAGTYSGAELTLGGLYSSQFGYDLTLTPGSLTIDPAALTVTVADATKTYNGLGWSGGNGVSYSGFVNSETSAVLGGSLSYGGTAQGAINAGSYGLTASGLTASNYTISYTPGTLTVNPAALTVTVADAIKTYNGLAWSGGNGVSYSGFVNSETASVLGGSLAFGGTAQGAINAGSYGLTASGLTASNYTISYTPGTLLVNPAGLSVIANSFTIPQFSPIPPLTFGVTGLIGADDAASVIEGALATNGGTTIPGSYAISEGTLRTRSSNYEITEFLPGTLTVTGPDLDLDGGDSEAMTRRQMPVTIRPNSEPRMLKGMSLLPPSLNVVEDFISLAEK